MVGHFCLDHDGVINRNNDITFSDRTEREQEALLLVSDYVDLARGLINIAKNHGAKENIRVISLSIHTDFHGRLSEYKDTGDG
jgi:NTE family protein